MDEIKHKLLPENDEIQENRLTLDAENGKKIADELLKKDDEIKDKLLAEFVEIEDDLITDEDSTTTKNYEDKENETKNTELIKSNITTKDGKQFADELLSEEAKIKDKLFSEYIKLKEDLLTDDKYLEDPTPANDHDIKYNNLVNDSERGYLKDDSVKNLFINAIEIENALEHKNDSNFEDDDDNTILQLLEDYGMQQDLSSNVEGTVNEFTLKPKQQQKQGKVPISGNLTI